MGALEFSPALLVGIVLLVLVGGLALKQRHAVHTPGVPARAQPATPSPSPPPGDDADDDERAETAETAGSDDDHDDAAAAADDDDDDDEASDVLLPDRQDPVLGTIAWNGDCGWHNVAPFRLGRHKVSVLFLAGPEGPGDEHRAWLAAAIARGDALGGDARALVAATSAGEVTARRVTLHILVMGGDEHGRFIGGLSCVTPVKPSHRYVWSRDRWATLSLDRG